MKFSGAGKVSVVDKPKSSFTFGLIQFIAITFKAKD